MRLATVRSIPSSQREGKGRNKQQFFFVLSQKMWLSLWVAVSVVAGDSKCFQTVSERANAVLTDPILSRVSWSMNVSFLPTSASAAPLQSAFWLRGRNFVVPASNNKLPTTAAAFRR